MVDATGHNPLALGRARDRLATLSKEIIALEQILRYLAKALEMMDVPSKPLEQVGRSLYQRLEITSMCDQMLRRVEEESGRVAESP